MDRDPGLAHFKNLGEVADVARTLLAQALARGGDRVDDQDKLDTTLRHLGDVREGFLITVRTSSFRSRSELRDLVRAILVDWRWLEPLGLKRTHPAAPLEKPVVQVIAFAHAAVTLGAMRHLPSEHVTFPHPRKTYADIPPPRSPGEVLERIEEMETVIARSAIKPLHRFGREPVRRTYGYFETGAWLIEQHARRFGTL
jgi:hypothetical protein